MSKFKSDRTPRDSKRTPQAKAKTLARKRARRVKYAAR